MTHPSAFRRFLPAIVAASLLIALAAFWAVRRPEVLRADIAVSSYPLLDITRSIAGQSLRVTPLLPPGADPHSFEPGPSTLQTLADVRVLYAIGHGFDDWVDPLVRESSVEKIVVDDGIALRTTEEHEEDEEGQEEEDDHGPIDPHYWLDPRNAILMATTIANDLSVRFPDRAEEIMMNLASFEARIDAADRRARMLLEGLDERTIVTLHDAWYYFADAYDLTILGTFEPTAGREPTPKQLMALERAIDTAGTTTLYMDAGGAMDAINAFAKDNDLTVVALDPMEGSTEDAYDTILLRNVQTILDQQGN